MVLFVRILACLIRSIFRSRISPFDQGTIHMRVWPNDLDLNVHANNGRYLSYTDVGRLDLLLRTRMLRTVIARRLRPMVGGAMISYRKPLMPFERFAVRSRVLCWDEKWFYFEHIIDKADGEVAAIVTIRGLLRGPRGNVPPSELTALESPPMPEFIARWREVERRE